MTNDDKLAAAYAENALLDEERAYWKDLYETYCKPEDVRAMEEQRDAANQRAEFWQEEARSLTERLAEARDLAKERSDWGQRAWLAWCSARDRAQRALTATPADVKQ